MRWRFPLLPALLLFGVQAPAQNVLTGNYTNSRTNANLAETTLTPVTVGPDSFGKLFSLAVDGQIYAQPLYMQKVTVSGAVHNVLFVATMHNTVYAFDADTASTPLWSVNLGTSVPTSKYTSDTGAYTDITLENGILGTPVIDASTGTLYAVAATYESSKFIYRLHALDTGTGKEKFGAPVVISATVAGTGDGASGGSVAFNPQQHLQRPALLLLNGALYLAFGSHGDAVPFHGWVMAYSPANVQTQMAVFNPSPNGTGGSFWHSGRGLVGDELGNVYGVTSNGTTDGITAFSESVLKLVPGKLTVADWFAPYNYQSLTSGDVDLGAAGAVFIDGTNFLVTGGKQGIIYLLDRTKLGQTVTNDTQIPQRLDTLTTGIYNIALWNRPDGPLLYLHTINSPVTLWKLTGGKLSTTPVAHSVGNFPVPYQGMTLSANGGTPGSGVLWVLVSSSYPLPSHAVLRAYNAEKLTELWDSDTSDGDAIGAWVKFATPTVANGKVYVPTGDNEVLVYGPIKAVTTHSAPIVTGIVNAASYSDGPIAPGEIVAVFGDNVGPATLTTGTFGKTNMLTTQIGSTQVTFNGTPGPLLYTSEGATAAIVPYEVGTASRIAVQVTYNGLSSAKETLNSAVAAPGVFSADASGSGPGAILNSDYTVNTPANPAKRGGIVIVYATGGGQTNPAAVTGETTAVAKPLVAATSVTIGGVAAKVLYAGNAGGEVAGAVQLNLQLPTGLTGTLPVMVTVGGQQSQATATVSIQ